MKYRKILLILAIATLSLTACKKEENPAPAEATAIEETKEETEPIVENDENMETITNADRGAATGEVIEAPAVETSEGTPFEEGEYIEPSVQENQNLSEYEQRMQRFNDDMKRWYEAGIISEEEYKAAIEYEPDIPLPGSETYVPSTSDEAFAQQYEEATIAARESSTNGKGNQVVNDGNYDFELPDEYKGR